MRKFFDVILPDEPFKTETTLNKKVQCLYDGPRYLLIRVDNSTDHVVGSVTGSDSLDGLNAESFNEEGHSFHVLDASANPFEAAYLTYSYTHPDIEPFEEVLPNGEKWEYHYEPKTGVLSHLFRALGLKFNNGKFSMPERIVHGTSREDFFTGVDGLVEGLTKSLSENDFLPEEKKILEDYKVWLTGLEKEYAGIDHWKIKFPTNIPMY